MQTYFILTDDMLKDRKDQTYPRMYTFGDSCDMHREHLLLSSINLDTDNNVILMLFSLIQQSRVVFLKSFTNYFGGIWKMQLA